MQALKRHRGSYLLESVRRPLKSPDFVGVFDMHQIRETNLEPHMACLLISAPGVESWRKPWLSDLTKRLVDYDAASTLFRSVQFLSFLV